MLLYINESSGIVKNISQEEQCGLLNLVDSFKEELEGWLKYKSLENKDPRYGTMSMQEFQHSLVMLDELLSAIKEKANTTELAELEKFKQSFK